MVINMKVEIMYKSRRNTKLIAEAMGKELGVVPKKLENDMTNVQADILFLGAGIYAGNVPPEVDAFIENLDSTKVKKIILFSTNGSGKDQLDGLKDKLKKRGLNVANETFACKGRSFIFMNRKLPGTVEMQEAAKFAKKMLKQ